MQRLQIYFSAFLKFSFCLLAILNEFDSCKGLKADKFGTFWLDKLLRDLLTFVVHCVHVSQELLKSLPAFWVENCAGKNDSKLSFHLLVLTLLTE